MIEDDATLLRRYALENSEKAFAELVRRYFDLVYSAAVRRTNGDVHLAADVSQLVFTSMARHAASLVNHSMLEGWLYAATRNAAFNTLRAEKRRRKRESEAHIMHETSYTPEVVPDWRQMRPVLDAAIDELDAPDREAVLLRFFQSRPFADVAAKLQTSEDTARKRVERAVEKLHALLARRGIVSTTAALAVVLTTEGAITAPANLVAATATAAIAGTATTGGGALGVLTLMSTSKIVAGIAVVVALALGGMVILEKTALRRATESNSSLSAELASVRASYEIPKRRLPSPSPTENFESLAAELAALDQQTNTKEFNRLLARLAKLDPLRTLSLVTSPNPQLQILAKNVILGTWMHDAPRVALEWAKLNYPDFFNMPEYADACVDLRDISLVEDWLLPSPEGDGKNFALRRLTQQWAKVDPTFITSWAQNLTTRGASTIVSIYAVSGALQEIARDAPGDAMQWIERTPVTDPNMRRFYFQAVAQGVNETGGVEAVEKLFRQQPNNPDYNLAINVIAQELGAKAPERVSELLSVLENPGSRLAAMSSALIKIAGTQPDLAAQLWVSHYPDLNAERFMPNLQRHVTAWAAKDSEAALHFVDTAPQLTPANRQQLRNAVLGRR